MNNAKCVRQSFTAGQSLPPGFCAARQCFCCKEVVITHVRVARHTFLLLHFVALSRQSVKRQHGVRVKVVG